MASWGQFASTSSVCLANLILSLLTAAADRVVPSSIAAWVFSTAPCASTANSSFTTHVVHARIDWPGTSHASTSKPSRRQTPRLRSSPSIPARGSNSRSSRRTYMPQVASACMVVRNSVSPMSMSAYASIARASATAASLLTAGSTGDAVP